MASPNKIHGLLPLEHLSVLEFSGADALAFLNGQLSTDVPALAVGEGQLASYNSPKGRVIALLHLARESHRALAALPVDLASTVLERLRKYVLRSKVTLRAATELAVYGSIEEPAQLTFRDASSGPIGDGRLNEWQRSQIAAGRPQIYSATSEQFVAQMLNLDRIGGISFHKGCYTGQEIIARMQNLGRVKRRMLRFGVTSAGPVAVGQMIALGEYGSGAVVDSVALGDSQYELLAVIHVDREARETAATGSATTAVHELRLPYDLTDR